ncbi:BPI fold-containing family A member 3-like isoform X2 [Notamacropus eugenii]|uniref:BPI fold-containing family A member 3-like isoform X2 n=1 Tax=Notamacropus eugenii TaxID=9315 RepID=UPI003B685B97
MEILQQQPMHASPISAMLTWPFSIQMSGMKMLHLWSLMLFCCLFTLTLAQLPENVPRNMEAVKLQPCYYWKDNPDLPKFMAQNFITALFDALKTVETPSTTIIGKLMGRAESNLQEFLELNNTNAELFHSRIQTAKEQPHLSSKIPIKFNMEFKVPVTKHMILLHVTINMPAEVKAEKDKKSKIHLTLGSCITEDNSLNTTIA